MAIMNTQETTTNRIAESVRSGTIDAQWSAVNLKFAWDGLQAAWQEEGGFRNHVIGALLMVAYLMVLRPDAMWWAIGILCSAMLIVLELFNCVIERVIDHIDDRFHPQIKLIKDMSAGAVVVASFGVFLVGVTMMLDTFGWFA